MSWYSKGNSGNRDEMLNASNKRQVRSFWLKAGESREVVFLDDPQFLINEVSLKINTTGDFEQYTVNPDGCPMVAAGYNPYPIEVYTILDLTPWKDDKNVEHKFTRRLFKAKGKKTIEMLKDRREIAKGSLVGAKVKIKRLTDKSTSCGDDFQVIGKIDLSKIPEKDREIFKYEEILAPLPTRQLEAKLKYAAPPMKNGKRNAPSQASNLDDVFGSSGEESQMPSFEDSSEIPF